MRAFYGQALEDPLIGFIFTDVAKLDLDAHVPKITSFWETILLGAQTYRGGAFRPHAALHRQVPLRSGHFVRWLVIDDVKFQGNFAARVGVSKHASPSRT